jgi:hypothetical protein
MGAKVIILPRDRLAWHRQMAEDVELSHVAFRVGVSIGTYFNNRTGKTFVGYERLAGQLHICRRTAWSAVRELVGRGHLKVEAGGGRAVANEYQMVLKTVQPNAPFDPRETVQNDDQNGATDCTTTLTDLSDQNSTDRKSPKPRGAPRDRKGAGQTKEGPSIFRKGSAQWNAWLAHYDLTNPARAAMMRSQAERGRDEWSERAPWPPGVDQTWKAAGLCTASGVCTQNFEIKNKKPTTRI